MSCLGPPCICIMHGLHVCMHVYGYTHMVLFNMSCAYGVEEIDMCIYFFVQ